MTAELDNIYLHVLVLCENMKHVTHIILLLRIITNRTR